MTGFLIIMLKTVLIHDEFVSGFSGDYDGFHHIMVKTVVVNFIVKKIMIKR